ncbi:hypothetical protein O181_034460 [Austropuccinia psidii MF-1]|uniref:Reverse transcriptase domain-containing protein n=1 Tax=Austropuccinia psidii MF-1 TaxID=1389203 RepID=A0A9Q3D325_9BASI|nr:hypothetical protein [Austropuccinia psidii MF-1]
MILLDAWIKEKWRKGKLPVGLFLNVKSAYPAVHREKLVQVLTQKQAPDYIIAIIKSFFLTRYTEIKLDDFKSQMKLLEMGLPQGSPLSFTLYLLYNYKLIDADIGPVKSNWLLIGYIDDGTHLVTAETMLQTTKGMKNLGRRTIEWARKMGSEFTKKKTYFMLISRPKEEHRKMKFGEEFLNPSNSKRWLEIILDSKLTYAKHIEKITSRADVSLAGINRISINYLGICIKDTHTCIKEVLYTRILLGSVLWLKILTQNKVKPVFEKSYNREARMVMVSLNPTAPIFLKRDSELKSTLLTNIVQPHNMAC